MFKTGDRIKVNTPPTQEYPQGLWVPQVIIDEPEQVRVVKDDRTYINTVAPVLARHPVTGAMYIRPQEILNFSLPRFTNVVGLDITEDGETLVTTDTVTKTKSIERLMEFFEQWTEANPRAVMTPATDIEA